VRKRVLFVGRVRYRLPLDASLARKFDALRETMDVRVLASAPAGAPTGDATFRLVPPFRLRRLDGLFFYLTLPYRIARELRGFRPDAVIAQTAYEAFAALLARAIVRIPARVIVDVHADWRTSTRLYGSPHRRLLGPLGDRVSALALRRADAVRTISGYTTGLVRDAGIEPAGVFPAYMDLDPFLERPPEELPERPVALFVGVLEAYKNVDGLADAWRRVARNLPDARLRIVGKGTRTDVVERLVAELPEQVSWDRELATPAVAAALDEASLLVLPSRSEGLGRVVIEALCRARPVVGSRVGGIPDLIEDGRNGLLVEPGDTAALADALERVLTDRGLLERLAAEARPSVEAWLATPAEYAARVQTLVEHA
jgi:glycosyltransferase involved in cell wall biosynthesis